LSGQARSLWRPGTIVNALFPDVPVGVGVIMVAIWVVRLHHARRYAGRYPARFHPDVLHGWRHGADFLLPVQGAVGGWEGITSITSTLYNPNPFTLLPDMAGEAGYLGYFGASGWMYWGAAWMAIGLGSVPTQDLFQRSMSARNESTAVWGTYLAGVLYLFFGIMSPWLAS
jgi:hypothetical protein